MRGSAQNQIRTQTLIMASKLMTEANLHSPTVSGCLFLGSLFLIDLFPSFSPLVPIQVLLPAAGLGCDVEPLRLICPTLINPDLSNRDAACTAKMSANLEDCMFSQNNPAKAGEWVAAAASQRSASWMAVSCVVSSGGEILAVDHSVQGITAGRPRCLAVVAQGQRVRIRRLEREEAHQRYGARADRLLGCAIQGIIQQQHSRPCSREELESSSKLLIPKQSVEGGELVLFARSEEDFDDLCSALGPWLCGISQRPAVRPTPPFQDTDQMKLAPALPTPNPCMDNNGSGSFGDGEAEGMAEHPVAEEVLLPRERPNNGREVLGASTLWRMDRLIYSCFLFILLSYTLFLFLNMLLHTYMKAALCIG